jgi:RNA polymerase sigma-70 factor (ECF subfamily)
MENSSLATQDEEGLLQAARDGDEDAFGRLVSPYRSALHAHCYRMLGSTQDAEDALQEAMIRAWRGLPRFQARGSVKPWLYKIATNTSLDAIGKRPKRVLPIDHAPVADMAASGPGVPLVESVWIEPYPDETLAVTDGEPAPDARYEEREGVELAFIAALQYLPPQQRAVLILREVLGYSAKEVADLLDTSVAGVNSAMQRARKAIDERAPEQTQQATLRALGDDEIAAIVENYMDALGRHDVDKVVSMLTEDATWSMPPLASWFGGSLDAVAEFLRLGPLSGEWDWRHRATTASGQPAIGAYSWDEGEQAYLPFALDILTLRGDRIAGVTAFITRSVEATSDDYFARWPAQPNDPEKVARIFIACGLPPRVDA